MYIPYNRWLHMHDDCIRAEYPDRCNADIAGETGVDYYTVSRRAKRLGVSKSDAFMHSSWKKGGCRRGRKKRTADIEEYLKAHFRDTKNEELAAAFGVDVKTIRRWARSLQLTKGENFMAARSKPGSFYTDEQKEYRNRRIEEVYPDAGREALQRLAEELGISVTSLSRIANKIGVKRSTEATREARRELQRRQTKYGPDFIAALAAYYPTHTNCECADHFGINKDTVRSLAWRNGMKKTREHNSRVRRNNRKKK